MAGDPHWDKVVLAMHMDGANASTVFTDRKGKTVTAVGNAQISTAQSKFGGASAKLDGSGDYLTTPDSPDFAFGSGDFTIDFYIYPVGTSGIVSLLHKGWPTNYSPFMVYGSMGASSLALTFYAWVSGASWAIAGLDIGSAPNNQWSHCEINRSGNSFRTFIEGVQTSIGTYAINIGVNTQPVRLGNNTSNTEGFNGYICDLRITKGAARHTANFTPPASPFMEWLGQVIGTIRDDAGALCARTVRAYLRSSGALVGSATSDVTTGAYTINTQSLDEHTVIALDDVAGTQYNALVLDKITPA